MRIIKHKVIIFILIQFASTLVYSNEGRQNEYNRSTNTILSNRNLSIARRRLKHRPYFYWFSQANESLETENGVYPNLACPLGTYRNFANRQLRIPGGLRLDGCIECPKGKYGDRTDLKSSNCTASCPKGTYLDKTGGVSLVDCILCPEGTYGNEEGLTTKECSGLCTNMNTESTKYYSSTRGLNKKWDCKICPAGYSGWQCESDMKITDPKENHYQNELTNFHEGHDLYYKKNQRDWNIE